MSELEQSSSTAGEAEKAPIYGDGDGTVASDEDATDSQDMDLTALGYKSELTRNRSVYTILFQSLAIAALPYGEGSALTSAIIGGGQLPFFVGFIVVSILDQAVAMSLAELASAFPTSAGPHFWAYQLSRSGRARTRLAFVTGWIWLVGNWTITLSVNFGMASFVAGTVTMYHPNWTASAWELLFIFYAFCIGTFLVCTFGNRLLPYVDTAASIVNGVCILVVFIALSASAKVGRHSAGYALAHYDQTLSGWKGFSFFIGLLPAAYTFSAVGMISSMAEEVHRPETQLPKAMSLSIPIAFVAGLFFILPICFTLPPLQDIANVPSAQGLPYIFHAVMGSPGGGLALMFFILAVGTFCSVSITTTASRCTWAFARDGALPWSHLWTRLHLDQVPVCALALTTVVQMLLGLINLGSSSAFTAFVSVGVMGLALAYAIPITVSMLARRRAVSAARFRWPAPLGWTVNIVAVLWITFQLILFSMPTALPVTKVSMNYSSVVLVGFMFLSTVYYIVWARKVYKGPPAFSGL